MKNALFLLFFGVFLLSACSPREQIESIFLQADSLLEEHPDSALSLLQAIPAPQELSRKEAARYALLLAQATDKCVKPLLPCDSLLNIALDYYDDDEKERAVALLYKGRLEAEMEQNEQAIGYFLEGLKIINRFPKEIETKRHLLSSLGNEYFDARLHEKAGNIFHEMYEYCTTEKDKAIALDGLSSYYSVIEKEDSALIFQCKALEYAQASKDSMSIATFALNLSVEYNLKEAIDTALYYARMSLQWLPENEKRSIYYANIGEILLDKEEKDSAIYYINKSLEDSTDIKGRASALLNLSYIKEEQKDYQATVELLYQFVDIIDSICFTEQSTKIQQLIHKYDIQMNVHEEQIKRRNALIIATSCFVCCCLLIAFFFQNRINKRKRLQLINEQKLKEAQEKLTSLQTDIKESQHIVALLQKEQANLMQEKENNHQEILEREAHIEKLEAEKEALRNWLFRQSEIYAKITKLSKQEVSDKKELKVLTETEQKKLMKTVFSIYADHISYLKSQHSRLTDEDLLYLCLEKAEFSPQTIALCFGNTGTHILAQRKYRMKAR